MKNIITAILFILISLASVYGQKHTITIVDEKEEPIHFVSVALVFKVRGEVQVKNIVSDYEGDIVIDKSWQNVSLKLRHVGYQSKNIVLTSPVTKIVMYTENLELNTLVVTGQYAPSSDAKSVHKVKVIDAKRIQAQGAVNLQELMEQEMNVRVSQDKFLGSSMSIQGVSGENVKILIDGVPVIGRQNGNIDLSQINLNNIERVEIVEGPLSVSYGTNALGGTINLITKKNKDKLAAHAEGYYETIGQYNVSAGIDLGIKSHSLSFTGGRNYFDGYSKVDTTRVMDWKPKEQYFGGVKYANTIKKVSYTLSSDLFKEKLTSRGLPRSPYKETAFDDYFYTNRFSNSLNLSYKPNSNNVVNVLGGYNYFKRVKNQYLKDLVNIEYTLVNTPGAQDTNVFDLIFSRGTFSHSKDSSKINYQLGYDVNLESTKGERIDGEEREIGDYAVFGSMEYNPTSRLVIKPGLRYSYNTSYKSPVIPSLNLKYQWTDHLSVRASYGKGFRAPSLKELHFLFVDINHNVLGNENLLAEESNNIMLQMGYKRGIKRGVYNFDVSGFYNGIKNQISLALIDASTQLYTYTNIGEFYSNGINFNSGFRYKTYKTSFGASYIGRYNLDSKLNPQIKKYSYSPEFSISFIYEVEKWQTSFNMFYKYSGKLLGYSVDDFGEVSQYQISDYGMMDFSVVKFFFDKKISTTLGTKNVLNIKDIQSNQVVGGIHSSGGGGVPVSWGRTFFIKLALNIN
jgi:outer membrane receptor for ferrienterochelin and colicins